MDFNSSFTVCKKITLPNKIEHTLAMCLSRVGYKQTKGFKLRKNKKKISILQLEINSICRFPSVNH